MKFAGKTYVISDIHGRFKALQKLLTAARVDFSKDRIYFLGDYVDWGDESLAVLRYLKLMDGAYENVYCTIGNHDYMAYKCLSGNGDEPSKLNGAEIRDILNETHRYDGLTNVHTWVYTCCEEE